MLLMSAWQNWDIRNSPKNNPYYVLLWGANEVERLFKNCGRHFQRRIFWSGPKILQNGMEGSVLYCSRASTRRRTRYSVEPMVAVLALHRSEVYFIWSVWSESVGTCGMQDILSDKWHWCSLGWLKQLSFGWLKQLFHGGEFSEQVMKGTSCLSHL